MHLYRIHRIFAALCGLSLLAACGTTTRTVSLSPQVVGSNRVTMTEKVGTCDTPFAFLDRGINIDGRLAEQGISRSDDELVVGFMNLKQPGADPLPCDAYRYDVFQALVRFDLTGLNVLLVQNAFLTFDWRAAIVAERLDRETCEMAIARPIATWRAGWTERSIPTRDDRATALIATTSGMPAFNASRDGTARLRVSAAVRGLMRDGNAGFVFSPKPEKMFERDIDVGKMRDCVAEITNPVLEIEYLAPDGG